MGLTPHLLNINFENKLPGRSHLRDILLVLCVLFLQPSYSLFWAGAGLFVIAMALRLWAKGILRRNKKISTGGPYALCRHPFYLGNLLLDLSLCLMAGNIWLAAIYLPVFLLIYTKTMKREETYLLSRFPEEYPAVLRLNRLLPVLPSDLSKLAGDWQMKVLLKESEVSRLCKILAIASFLYWIQIMRHEWWEALEFDGLILLFTTILLQLLGHWIHVALERPGDFSPFRRKTAFNVLVAGMLAFGMVSADAANTSAQDLSNLARENHLQKANSSASLMTQLAMGKKVLTPDDVVEDMSDEKARTLLIERTFMQDFEAYHVIQGSVAAGGNSKSDQDECLLFSFFECI